MSWFSADTFTRANQSGWGTASNGETYTQSAGTATLAISSNEGTLTGATGSNIMLLGSNTAADVEGLVRFSMSSTSDQIGLVFRSGASNARVEISNNLVRLRVAGTVIGTNGTTTIAANTFYWLRARAVGSNYYARVWADGNSEPTAWTTTWTDSSLTSAGKWGLFASLNSSSDTVKFDSFTMTPGARSISATAALLVTTSRTIPGTAALLVTTNRTIPATAALLVTSSRTLPSTVALLVTASRTVPATVALLATTSRTIPATVALLTPGTARTIPVTAALLVTSTNTIPASVALLVTSSRSIPATVALLVSGTTRTVPATAALLLTSSRSIPATAALSLTSSRTIPVSGALLATSSRSLPATASLKSFGLTRTIPASASLYQLTFTTSKGRHFPPDGFYIYDAISPTNPATYKPRLAMIAAAGFKGVLNYDNLYVTGSQLVGYINDAWALGLRVIVALNEAPLWNGTPDISATYPAMTASAGSVTGPGVVTYVVNLVKSLPGVWGYYVGDEVGASNHSLLKTHADLIKSTDGSHPRLLVDGVLDAVTFAAGNSPFYDCCDVGASDHYPVGSYDGTNGNVDNGLDKTAGYATNVQAQATLHGFSPAFVCQAFSYQRYYPPARCTPYPACAPYPSRYKMREERDLVLANMYPRIMLVYSFFDTIQNVTSPSYQELSNWRDVAWAYNGVHP